MHTAHLLAHVRFTSGSSQKKGFFLTNTKGRKHRLATCFTFFFHVQRLLLGVFTKCDTKKVSQEAVELLLFQK